MKLTFLGTRGYIDAFNARHRRHTSTLISYRDKRVMIDCGEDWFDKVDEIAPHAIVITHPHPDHAFGLKAGTSCPVYAIGKAWEKMKSFPIEQTKRRLLAIRKAKKIAGITFEAFPVVHSTRAPAVGYRIQAGGSAIFYVPDVVQIHGRSQALRGIDLYVGDGATLTRPILRREKQSNQLIGHTAVMKQLDWCGEGRRRSHGHYPLWLRHRQRNGGSNQRNAAPPGSRARRRGRNRLRRHGAHVGITYMWHHDSNDG